MGAPALLEIENIRAAYGANEVIHGVSLTVDPGSIVALLGHNGAGKTTIAHTIFGIHRQTYGTVSFRGQSMAPGDTVARVRRRMALVPQTGNVFPQLSVRANLQVAVETAPTANKQVDDPLAIVRDVFPILNERLGQRAGQLSGGQRQMLAVSMALVKGPELLILDEPTLGIAPILVQRLMQSLVSIRDELGTSILLIEQAIHATLKIADYAYVMRMGKIELAAPAAEALKDPGLWRYF